MRWRVLAMVAFSGCPLPPYATGDGGSSPNPNELGGPCLLEPFPEALDFGEVESFTESSSRVHLANRSNRFVAMQIGELAPPFHVSAVGPTRIGPAENLVLNVTFQPLDGRLHLAEVNVDGGPGCVIKLPVRGLGSGFLQTSPTSLEFGALNAGQSKTLTLNVTNSRRLPVTLEGISLFGDSSSFSFAGPSRVELPALGSVAFAVTATPSGYGSFSARLVASTGMEQLSVPLEVSGGLPVAQVSPTVIDVPMVGLFPGSVPPSSWEREVIVRNAANDAGADVSPLKLSATQPFTLERLDGGDPSELVVQLDPVLQNGLRAGREAVVLLRMLPQSLGPREYRLTLFTNDPAQAERVVTISTTSAFLPLCTFEASPPQGLGLRATFGFPGSRGEIRFRNTGTTNCTLDDLRMNTGSDPAFRVTDGGAGQVVVGPGLTHVVVIDGPDAGLPTVRADFSYQVFNPNSSRRFVPLYVSQ